MEDTNKTSMINLTDKHWLLDSYQFLLLSFLGDSQYRNKLKNWLKTEFGDQISFLLSEDKKPEVVVATTSLTSTSFYHDTDRIISKAAKIIRTKIQDKFKHNLQPTWPPSAEQINSEVFRPLTNLLKLIETILATSTNRASRSKKIRRLTKSISQDIVFNCLQGKVL